jgi:hypothetical protein
MWPNMEGGLNCAMTHPPCPASCTLCLPSKEQITHAHLPSLNRPYLLDIALLYDCSLLLLSFF